MFKNYGSEKQLTSRESLEEKEKELPNYSKIKMSLNGGYMAGASRDFGKIIYIEIIVTIMFILVLNFHRYVDNY